MTKALLVFALLAACGGSPSGTAGDEPDPAPAVCDWTHREGCAPCPDRRDYGAGNTCEDVIWKGRSPTDFCLQTFPCDYTPKPATPIEN